MADPHLMFSGLGDVEFVRAQVVGQAGGVVTALHVGSVATRLHDDQLAVLVVADLFLLDGEAKAHHWAGYAVLGLVALAGALYTLVQLPQSLVHVLVGRLMAAALVVATAAAAAKTAAAAPVALLATVVAARPGRSASVAPRTRCCQDRGR